MKKPTIATLLTYFVILVLAGTLLAGHLAFSPLVPPELAATPTAHAERRMAEETATAEAQLAVTSVPVLYDAGIALKEVSINRCPGANYATGRTIPAGDLFDVSGWSLDVNAAVWILVKDERDSTQEWVRFDEGVEISPESWRSFYPTDTPCRF
jgi:hypothetical protein